MGRGPILKTKIFYYLSKSYQDPYLLLIKIETYLMDGLLYPLRIESCAGNGPAAFCHSGVWHSGLNASVPTKKWSSLHDKIN